MSRPPVTVVIPCRDRPDFLRQCLSRLIDDLGAEDAVVVADSASRDAKVATVAHELGARVVRCAQPGTSRARNAGWSAAATDVVAFLDDDVLVESGWADRLVAPLAAADVGYTLGHTTLPAGYEAHGMTASVHVVEPTSSMTVVDNVGAPGGNFAIRRSALARTGGFDERLGPGTWLQAGEDIEFLDRVIEAGLSGVYVRDAVATHEQWRDASEQLRLQWAYGKGMGARVAAAIRRDPRAGLRLVPVMLRLGGLVTVARRLRRRDTVTTDDARAARPVRGEPQVSDVSGWRGPLLWRVGALVGFAVGLVRLTP